MDSVALPEGVQVMYDLEIFRELAFSRKAVLPGCKPKRGVGLAVERSGTKEKT
jgi:hypothetical protein